MVAVRNTHEVNLAWALIDVARPHLDIYERNHIFVRVGAGDTYAAIRLLVKLVADKQILLRPQLVHLCTTWLDSYGFHEEKGLFCRDR